VGTWRAGSGPATVDGGSRRGRAGEPEHGQFVGKDQDGEGGKEQQSACPAALQAITGSGRNPRRSNQARLLRPTGQLRGHNSTS